MPFRKRPLCHVPQRLRKRVYQRIEERERPHHSAPLSQTLVPHPRMTRHNMRMICPRVTSGLPNNNATRGAER
eukprot:2581641-Prymnesium_polylepis.1